MFRIFRDPAHQQIFERDGFVQLPLLESAEVDRLLAYYRERFDGCSVENAAYGVFVSMFRESREGKLRTIDLIRDVVLPRAELFCQDFKPHLGSYIVKVPDPGAYTWPHQDWTFVDDERLDHYFSITVWIALTPCSREEGGIGFVKGSHRFVDNVNCSPSPASPTPTDGLEPLLLQYLTFPEIELGHAIAFNNKTIHASLPNNGSDPRVAIAFGMTPREARLYHYFLKPGVRDRLLKLEVEEEFFLHYDNDRLQALWEAGEVPDRCRQVAEIQHHHQQIDAAELEAMCVRAGSQRNGIEVQLLGTAA